MAGACPGGGTVTGPAGQDGDYSPTPSEPRYTVYNPVEISSVTADNRTGLMWVTRPATDAGFNGPQTWENAITSCTATLNGLAYAGYPDWRLPNARELISIVDYGTYGPSIDATAFPGTRNNNYWTSTTKTSTTYAWVVSFGSGQIANTLKSASNYTWCVRGGP